MNQPKNIDSVVELHGDLARKHKAYVPTEAEATKALVAQDFETLAAIPEQLLSMVGYSIHPPFMGMVNGMHPKRTLSGKTKGS